MTGPDQAAPPPWRRFVVALAPLALLFAALMGAGAILNPPPVRQTSTAAQFDAAAARARLARILGDATPHPVDSAAEDAVRARLLHEIEALGFSPQVHQSFACRAQPRAAVIDCALVRNIVFSAGPEVGPAVLAAAHYDSVPAGPGASDDGVGMAVLLEAARLLKRDALQRRVVFLVSDGEEPGLLGARAFAQDPLMAQVQALVNVEARGSRGPAMFFESNQPNADAVAAFARSPRPLANSVMADVYTLLPNSTDVTALTRPGLDVVNIALLDGLEDYHTPLDSLASFNARSLQHMGDMALATLRAFAQRPDGGRRQPLVYTDIASYGFVSAPSWAGQAALALSALVAFGLFWRTGEAGRWRAFWAPPLALGLAGVLATMAALALGALRAGEAYWFAHPEATRAWCVLLALLGVVLAVLLLRAKDPAQTGAVGAFWFAAIGFAASLALPGVSILFALPAVFYALGGLVSLAWRPALPIGAALAAIMAIVIWAPTLHLVELALGFDFPFAFAVLVALMCFSWLGALARAGTPAREPAVVLAAGALACVVAAALLPAATPGRPRPLNITYFADTAQGQARVLAGSARRRLPRELAAALTFEPQLLLPGDENPTWAAPAPAQPVAAPALEGVTIASTVGAREVRARLRTNGAYRAVLRMPRAAAPLRAIVNGVETSFADTGGAEADYLGLSCQGRACDGVDIVVFVGGDPMLNDWRLLGYYPGASATPARAAIARRPASATPIQFGDGVLTLSPVAP